MRALAAWPTWIVPATLQEGVPAALIERDPEGARSLTAFVDLASWEAWSTVHQAGDYYLTTRGSGVFALLEEGLAGLTIEADTDTAIHYTSEQFVALKQMGNAVVVEEILTGQLTAEDAFARLADHTYFVGHHAERPGAEGPMSEGHALMLAPDAQGRRLLAVFTAVDTAKAFEDQMKADLGFDPQITGIDGRTLFALIARAEVEGVVFNCSGPIAPKAIAKGFAKLVLQRVAEPHAEAPPETP